MNVTGIHARALLNQVNSTVWAILPSKLEAIAEFLALRANGEKVSPDEIRAIVSARSAREKEYSNKGGVAVLPLAGTILHRATAMQETSGLQSLEHFGRAFDAAIDNPDISTVVIRVDSPGGTVAGTPEMAQKIYAARSKKRIVAIADSLMASAAYYIASAAHEVVATPSAEVGSLGVFHVHMDVSGALEKQGVKPTITKFGRHKAESAPMTPLSDEAKTHLQEMVDTYGQMFVADVARFRGERVAGLHERYGEGRIFTAEKAKQVGMIDRVVTFEGLLAELGISRERLAAARMEDETPRIAAHGEFGETLADLRDSLASGLIDKATYQTEATNAVEALNAAVVAEVLTDAVTDNTDVPEATDAGASESHDDTSAPSGQPAEEIAAMSTQDNGSGTGAAITVGADALAGERKRVNAIYAACAHKVPAAMAEQFVEMGATVEHVNGVLTAMGAKENGSIGTKLIDLSPKEERQYSIARALAAVASGNPNAAGFEMEIQATIEKKLGRQRKSQFSVMVPTNGLRIDGDYSRPVATLTSTGATSGDELVFTEPGSFIDLLRNRLVTAQMGATFLPGLQGDVAFPKQSGAGTFSWRSENPGSDVSLSDIATTQVTLSPNDGTSATTFSRRLLAQSVINVEQLVRRDLAAICAIGLDRAALHGTGGSEPTGIYSQSGVNSLSVEGPILHARLVEMETAILADNADVGVMAYVTTPEIRGDAKTTEKATNTGQFLWNGSHINGEMNGFRAFASNQVSKTLGAGSTDHGMIFGVWDQLLIGEWGAMELIVDPYTLASQGLIKLVIHLMADVAVRYPEAFCKATGLTRAAEQS